MAKRQTKIPQDASDRRNDIRTIVFQIVDIRNGKTIKEHELTVLPQTFQLTPLGSRDTLQHTPSGIFIDRWGKGAGRLTITGVMENKSLKIGDREIDGASSFKDLRDMFEDFIGSRNKDTEQEIFIRVGEKLEGPFPRSLLQLHMFILADTLAPPSREETPREWYEVHVPQNYMTFQKNIGERHANFPYSLNFVLVRRLDEVLAEGTSITYALGDVPEEDKPKTKKFKRLLSVATGRVTTWASALDALADETEATLGAVDIKVRRAFAPFGRLQNSIERFVFLFDEFVTQVDRYVDATENFIDFPLSTAVELKDITRKLYNVYTNAIDIPDATQSEIRDTLRFIEQVTSRRELFLPPLQDRLGNEYESSIRVVVTQGMTLKKLSYDYGVSVDDIIKLNRLEYPFIQDFDTTAGLPNFGRNVLKWGDVVLIPRHGVDRAVDPAPQDFSSGKKTDEERFFGTAWLLDRDGDMHGDSSRTALLRVSGLDNVLQALRVRYSTERVSFISHPLYGMDRHIGRRASTVEIEMLRIDLYRQTAMDPRVDVVEEVKIGFTDAQLADVEVKAKLREAQGSSLLNVESVRT